MRYFSLSAILLLALLLSACEGSDDSQAQENSSAKQTELASNPADIDVLTGKPKSEKLAQTNDDEVQPLPESDEPSPGMQMTLDGSSVQAFEDSMKVLQENMTAKEYNRLKTAVQYLSLYDFSNRGKDNLYASLDDMTPAQVEARAKAIMNR